MIMLAQARYVTARGGTSELILEKQEAVFLDRTGLFPSAPPCRPVEVCINYTSGQSKDRPQDCLVRQSVQGRRPGETHARLFCRYQCTCT